MNAVRVAERREVYSLKNYLIEGGFLMLYSLVKRFSFPFSNFMRYLIVKLFNKNIRCTYISEGVTWYFIKNISIGRGTSLNQYTILDGLGGIEIGNNVRIASNVTFNTADHKFHDRDVLIKNKPIM